jgi:hypothetical protein
MSAIFQAVSLRLRAVGSRVRVLPVILGLGLLFTACSPGVDGILSSVPAMSGFIRVVIAVVGLALMVAGFTLYEIIIQLIGFLTGSMIGVFLGLALGGDDGGRTLYAIIGFILGGVVGAAVAVFLTCLSVFLAGFLVGAVALGAMVGGLLEDIPNAAVFIIGGIIGGLIMLALYRFWITALTSAFGAVLFGLATGAPPWSWFIFFLFGIACQYGLGKITGNEEKVRPGYRGAQNTPVRVGAAAAVAGAAAVGAAAAPPPAPLPAWQPQPPAEKFCPGCGKKMRAGALFCPGCGAKQ